MSYEQYSFAAFNSAAAACVWASHFAAIYTSKQRQ